MKIQSINAYHNVNRYNQTFRESVPKSNVQDKLNDYIKERDKNFTRAIIFALIIELGMVATACIKNKIDKDSKLQQKIENIYKGNHSPQKTFLVE